MASPPQQPPLSGPALAARILGPSLDKILKNMPWRKHNHLTASSKSAIDLIQTLASSSPSPSPLSIIPSLSETDAVTVLTPLLLALDSGYPKVIDPALDSLYRLFSFNLIRFDLDRTDLNSKDAAFQLMECVCKCSSYGDESVEFSMLKVLLSAVRSCCVVFRGNYLNHIVKTCYNVYLGGLNGTNMIFAKAVLAQIVSIMFARVEFDSMVVMKFKV